MIDYKLNNVSENKFRRFFLKVIKIVIGIFVTLFILAFVLLYIFKDEIGKDLLLSINKKQTGLLTVQSFTVNPFAQFPNISLGLQNVELWENKSDAEKADTNAILFTDDIYIAFDILKLIRGNLDVSEITISGGYAMLTTYPDSTMNISNALKQQKDSLVADTKKDTTTQIEILIDNLRVDDIFLVFDNKLEDRYSSFEIDEIDASLSHTVKESQITIDAVMNLVTLKTSGKEIATDKSIYINTNLRYDSREQLIDVKPGWIIVEDAQFNFDGTFDIKNDGDLNLRLTGSDRRLSFFSMILNDEALDLNQNQIDQGDLYFNGSVNGKTFIRSPIIDISFGVKDINLAIPRFGQSINQLNFDGSFNTGESENFSDANLKIINLSAKLPSGKTSGSFEINNFKDPVFDFNIYFKTEVSWIDKIFNLDLIENLDGMITLNADISAAYDKEAKRFIFDNSNASIDFENVSFTLPEILEVNKLNGQINNKDNDVIFDDLSIITKDSDLLLNGEFQNLMNLPFSIESDLTAELSLISEKFVFPEIFAFDSSAARSFPYTIYNLYLKTKAVSSTANFKSFDDFPGIDFSIDHLKANFDDLPNLTITGSQLNIYEDIFGFNMKFDPFNIEVAKGDLILKGAYNGSADNPYKLKSETKTKNLHVLDLLNQFGMSYDASSFFDANLDGSFFIEVEFPKDSINFKTFKMSKGDLTYAQLNKKDTIIFNSLNLDLSNVRYNLDENSNPFTTLSTAGEIKFEQFVSTQAKLLNSKFNLSIERGKYKIIPNKYNQYSEGGDGLFVLEPFIELPQYSFSYSIKDYPMEQFLETFWEDPLLKGKIDLTIDLLMKGDDWQHILNKLDGNISMVGKNLILNGLDIDILLNKFERSQNFTLLDVSAVLLTGPVGLAVTKGADVAMLVVGNPGETTKIPQLVSKWKITDGIITTEDVAFSTQKNRVAAKGKFDFNTKTLDMSFAVLNANNCSKISQTIFGQIEDPKFGDVKVLKTLLGPITNLWNSIVGNDCEPFYTGIVEHPVPK